MSISIQAIKRLPHYLNYLRSVPKDVKNISATQIADAIGLGDVQVRKDLSQVSGRGRPKIGYEIEPLIGAIQKWLSLGAEVRFCIVGMGHLGMALAHNQGFSDYGLELAAMFDAAPERIGEKVGTLEVLHMKDLKQICQQENIEVGVIAVPAKQAQQICDALAEAGVTTIWNFAPTHLAVPENVYIEHENMAAQLGILSRHLQKSMDA